MVGAFALLLSPAFAQSRTVDVAAAEAWLEDRFSTLLATTTTPVRALAAVAWSLGTTQAQAAVAATLVARQRAEGCWSEPGTSGALADQAFALVALAGASTNAVVDRGLHALLRHQRREGGWSSTLGRYDHPDTISTAWAVFALMTAGARPGNTGATAIAAARARSFVAAQQDPDSGAIGDQSSGFGHWAATAAGWWVLGTGDDPRTLPPRRALQALTQNRALVQPARQPLYALHFLRPAAAALPEGRAAAIAEALRAECARHQADDGHWPAPKTQPDADDALATALVLSYLRPARTPSAAMLPPRVAWRIVRPAGGSEVHVLLTLPAEPADLGLVDVRRHAARPLFVGYDAAAVESALLGRATNAAGSVRPWAAAVAELQRDLRAGPVTLSALADFVAAETLRRPEALLTPEDFLAVVDGLDAKAEQQLARQLGALPAAKLLADARAAWAHDDAVALARSVEAAIPVALRSAVATLRAKAADRLRERLRSGEPCDLLLDAWLALGPDGVLARLDARQAAGGDGNH